MSGNVIQGPFYNSGFYDTGAGGGGYIVPDDVELYEYLEQVATANNTNSIKINLGDEQNDEKKITIIYSVVLNQGNQARLIDFKSVGFVPRIYIAYNYTNDAAVFWSNKSTGGTATYQTGATSICDGTVNAFTICKDDLINAYNGNVVSHESNYYNVAPFGEMRIPTSSTQSAYNLKIHQIIIDDNEKLYHLFVAAKRGGNVGLLDKVTGDFYAAGSGLFNAVNRIFY